MDLFTFVSVISELDSCIKWMRENGLLKKAKYCGECNVWCSQIKLNNVDGCIFRCSKCRKKHSIRQDSFFSGSHLKLKEILLIVYMFVLDVPQKTVNQFLPDLSVKTLVDWFSLCRDICRCSYCMVDKYKTDVVMECNTCKEYLCNKCLPQHYTEHCGHDKTYQEDISHGYTKSASISSYGLLGNYKCNFQCLTTDILFFTHGSPLKLSIFNTRDKAIIASLNTIFAGNLLVKIAVTSSSSAAVSIPGDNTVLLASYVDKIINTFGINVHPGMTGGIAFQNNVLYLAFENEIRAITLSGEELTRINVPDVKLIHPVSNGRLLCVYKKICGPGKTMAYIDIQNNSLVPIDNFPFHPNDVAVDDEGNIIYVKGCVVWQAKSDGSDFKIIISCENYIRIFCFDFSSQSLFVGVNSSIHQYRKKNEDK